LFPHASKDVLDVIFVAFFEAGRRRRMLEFVEEPSDQVTEAIEVEAEDRDIDTSQ